MLAPFITISHLTCLSTCAVVLLLLLLVMINSVLFVGQRERKERREKGKEREDEADFCAPLPLPRFLNLGLLAAFSVLFCADPHLPQTIVCPLAQYFI